MDVLSGPNNQCRFVYPDGPVYEHQGLSFRSRTEIKIYDALVKRRVLVFPLPVAVLGQPGTYREPDFLVLYLGRSGVLEIHGEEFHPPETAATEHERRRKFMDMGVHVYEVYDARRCYNEPDRVVADFLGRIARRHSTW